jgi:hypothetical protein
VFEPAMVRVGDVAVEGHCRAGRDLVHRLAPLSSVLLMSTRRTRRRQIDGISEDFFGYPERRSAGRQI